MSEEASWATRLGDAVKAQLEGSADRVSVDLIELRVPSADVLELIFRYPRDGHTRGIRLDAESVRHASWRISESNLDELAFDLIHLGMREPRKLLEFTLPDQDGVMWLSTRAWLEEIG